MITPHMTELCALIADEKDSVKFLLLVRELNDAFENEGVKVEHALSDGRVAQTDRASDF